MADQQPEAQPAPLIKRGLATDALTNFEVGAVTGATVYGLHVTGQAVSKLKDKLKK
jgi:hypothetical protein